MVAGKTVGAALTFDWKKEYQSESDERKHSSAYELGA